MAFTLPAFLPSVSSFLTKIGGGGGPSLDPPPDSADLPLNICDSVISEGYISFAVATMNLNMQLFWTRFPRRGFSSIVSNVSNFEELIALRTTVFASWATSIGSLSNDNDDAEDDAK